MPRRTLSDKTAWDDIDAYLAYVEISLSLGAEDGDKELAALVPPVKQLITRWEALDGERRLARRAVIRANALVVQRDLELDAVTTDLHNAVLSAGNLDRKAPLFTRFFPRALSLVVKAALETQLAGSRALLQKLGQDDTPAALRKAHEKPLKDAIAAGDAAIKHRESVRVEQQQVTTRIGELRDAANRTLLTVEGSLKALAGKRNLGTDFVDAFFPSARATPKPPATPPPESARPTP